ncbi:hypothetical protein [Streptomyces sp. V4I2]|uniref:hypothetical protein n=1 Tax=Streptomyces sp. V4I2 TaxID=3042280 RepID=UPI002784F977|nr:hypothetical protein [Streptomyces sp. V4I2]MDQ1041829.1 hypothetical protein [Streptomyces sp. V4I2]
MDKTTTPVPASLPLQAPPICRELWQEPQERRSGHGVQAARSGCAELWGPARQMCYARRSEAL